mgnify:CR=1 FL=1
MNITLSAPDDAILIQPPVYHPFSSAVLDNGRRLVESELKYENGAYSIDFDDFEAKIVSENVKLFILCSPHNPVGRVWTEAEIRHMGEICLSRGVTVVADEIHCDFVLPGYRHTPFLNACPELAENTILCTAPSKTFNLAGLQCSNIFIPGAALRDKFTRETALTGYSGLNPMGMAAAKAAYLHGEEWLNALQAYLADSLSFAEEFFAEKLPKVKVVRPEGTYFAWVDFSGTGLSPEEINLRIVNRAKLWLDDGAIFGKSGEYFQRIVLACPRETLREALGRLAEAFSD